MDIKSIIALISSLVPVINNAVGFVNRASEALRQSGELTTAQEAKLDAAIDKIDLPAHWKSDSAT